MFRCVAVLSAKDRDQAEGLREQWRNDDPLQKALAGHVARYVRSRPLPSDTKALAPGRIFAVGEAWVSELGEALETCRRMARAVRDHAAYKDVSVSAVPYRQIVFIGGPESAGEAERPKAFYFACRKPGLSVEAFQNHWRMVHGALVVGTPGISRYVQCHPCIEAYRDLDVPFDSLAEITFDGPRGVTAFGEPSEPIKRQGADTPKLWNLTVRSPRFFLEEEFDTGRIEI